MAKKQLIKKLQQLAVEPTWNPDWDGVSGTFNIGKLADFILKEQ